jgi:superfamily I DNA and/or RNA helicase
MEQKLFLYYFSTLLGGEWDYVIFSTVRSLPDYKIEPNPTLGWCKHNLGFITDKNQINVALTRARKGLIIIGKY